LKAVANRFGNTAEPSSPTPIRRLLVVIRFVDGDWVLQKTQDFHKPRSRYKEEAKSLFRSMFAPKEEKFCAKSKADTALHEVLGFRRTSDLEAKSHFERDGVEWHPVILRVDYFGLHSSYMKKKANLEGRQVTPLKDHPYGEKLAKIFPS
jgi:hypothetical protein